MFLGYLYAHNFLFQNDLNLIITHGEACKDYIRGVDRKGNSSLIMSNYLYKIAKPIYTKSWFSKNKFGI